MKKDAGKSKAELLDELSRLRHIVEELRKSEVDLRKAEGALRESEERYRIAIEHSNDGVALVKGNRHVYVNRKFLEMFGYDDPEEILGEPFFLAVHPDDRERVMESSRKRQKRETLPSRYEFKGIRKDGTTLDIEVSSTWVTYRNEPATLAYLRDVTDRKRAEEELQEVRKFQAIGTMAGGIAHDFNNILAGIIGFSERALKDLREGNPARRYVDLIRSSGLRGRDLVRQILTFSRKTAPKPELMRLGPLVEETTRLVAATLPAEVRIETLLMADTDEIEADPSQIQQVLLNLMTNAAYAVGGRGGGAIEVCVMNTRAEEGNPLVPVRLSPGDYVVLTVCDDGAGMAKEVQERIFDPFFTTKPPGEGTGMGLSVVYGIVKAHNGAITVFSEPGKGTVFTVFLPVHEPTGSAEAGSDSGGDDRRDSASLAEP